MFGNAALINMLSGWKPGKVMQTAYDTAWVARLGGLDIAMSNRALNWICENQLPDGSWGAAKPLYYHDRVISTLAAMTALCRRGRRASDHQQVQKGLAALERISGGATHGLMADPHGATAGFEMIVPTLVSEAESLGILKRQGDRILGRLSKLRSAKLARLNGQVINRSITMAFSAEMAGPDHQHLLNLDDLQEENGSVAYNPSTTAYYATHACHGDPGAISYLQDVVDENGGAPIAAPFDVYERAWVLWNIALTGSLDPEVLAYCKPHLDYLENAWVSGRGVGFGTGYSIQDGDDTSLVAAVLHHFGRSIDLATIENYEEQDHFRCFHLEVNPSVSTNVHFLDVFRRLELPAHHPAVRKIIHYLHKTRIGDRFWFDKWHVSPYYTSAHVVIACSDYDHALAAQAIEWIVETQNEDGSWGFYLPSAEETAYALQALCSWNGNGGKGTKQCVQKGAEWLKDHMQPPYPALWIAKTLYYSEWVIRAEIISALIMADQKR